MDDDIGGREGSADSVVARVADEIESGAVPEEEIERLRAALLDGESGALEARVQKLQRDVDEVLAYASALEEFLDENGTGAELIETVRSDVDELREETAAIRTELEETDANVEQTASRVDGFEDTVEAELSGVDSELERIDAEIDSLQEWRRELVSVMSGAAGGDGGDGAVGEESDSGVGEESDGAGDDRSDAGT